MPPLALSDQELAILRELAEPIAWGQRQAFLQAVAAEIECAGGGVGVGLVHRVGRAVQRSFTVQSRPVPHQAGQGGR
jgi:hypothetical protein